MDLPKINADNFYSRTVKRIHLIMIAIILVPALLLAAVLQLYHYNHGILGKQRALNTISRFFDNELPGTYYDILVIIIGVLSILFLFVIFFKIIRPYFIKISDINGRKQREQARLCLAAIIESSEDAIISLTLDGIITSWNTGATGIYGYTAPEMLGQPVWRLVPPELRNRIRHILSQIEHDGNNGLQEFIWIGKDGSQINVSVKVSLLKDSNGQITGISMIHRDITEFKRFEEELASERERLLVTIGSIGDGVIVANNAGIIILMNTVAEDLTGYTKEESYGEPLTKVFYSNDPQIGGSGENIFNRVLAYNETVHLDNIVLMQKKRLELSVSLSCAPIKSTCGPNLGLILVFKDITEKQQTELELIKAEKLEMLGILAGGIAHDFNNILAAILANIQLAKTKLEKGADIKRYLEDTIETARKASDLTKQLLTFSKGGSPVKRSASIIDLIKDTTNFALQGSKIQAEFIIPDNLWPVEIDSGQISQVINNLIINAVQAMPNGGIIIVCAENLTIKPGCPYQPGNYIRLAIKDYGTGIPKEIVARIFEPFFTTKKEGTGLGLATSYSIIKKHDGYIELESREGIGSIFFLYLPASPGKFIEPKKPHLSVETGQGKILLMEDDDIIRKSFGEMLTDFGYSVSLTKDGQETIAVYQHAKRAGEPFDAVIMDLTVRGGLGGQETIALLRDIDPQIKAIVCSGYANDPIISDYQRFGFRGVVTKPYKFDELNQVLHQVMAKNNI